MVAMLIAMIGAVLLPSEASAGCGRRCANVAPPGQTPCLRCIEDPAVSSDCRNSAGSCGCFFVICPFASLSTDSAETALASIFSDGTEAAPCSGLPTEITAAAE